jgi:hypothetical protein
VTLRDSEAPWPGPILNYCQTSPNCFSSVAAIYSCLCRVRHPASQSGNWTAISKRVGPDEIYECCVPVCFLVYLTTIPQFKVVRPVAFYMGRHKYTIVTYKPLFFEHNHSHTFPLTSSHLQIVHNYIYNSV